MARRRRFSPRLPELRERRWLALYVAPVLLALALPALPTLTGEATLFQRDTFSIHLPAKDLQAEALGRGELPLVDPYRGGGQPFVGNPNTVPLYPDDALYLVLPFFVAFNLHFWLHLLLAPVGGYALGRAFGLGRPGAWAVGVAYGTSGYLFSHLNLYNGIGVVTWAPFLAAASVAALGRREPGPRGRALAGAGIAWALCLLAGDPFLAALALLVAASAVLAVHGTGPLVSLARRGGAWRLVGVLAAGTLVAAPQLVELARIVGVSFRGFYGHAAEARTAGSWDPRQLVEWLLPYAYGRPDRIGFGRFWGQRFFTDWQPFYFSLAPGLAALALLAAAGWPRGREARAHRWGWAVAAAGVFFALGRFNPVARLLWELPERAAFRYPVKLWLPVALGLAVVAGIGFERLLASGRGWRGARLRFAAALGTLAALYLALVGVLLLAPEWVEGLQGRFMPGRLGEEFLAQERMRWGATAIVSLVVLALAAAALRPLPRRPHLAGALLLLVQAGSQIYFQSPARALDEVEPYAEPSPLARHVPPGARVVHGTEDGLFGPQRLLDADYPGNHSRWLERRVHDELYFKAGSRFGRRYDLHTSPDGLDSFLAVVAQQTIERAEDDRTRLRLLSLWGIERLIVNRALDHPRLAEPLAEAESAGRRVWGYRLPRAAPEVALVGRAVAAPHAGDAVDLLTRPGFDASREAVVAGVVGEEAGRDSVTGALDGPAGGAGAVEIVASGPEGLVADVDAYRPALLVWQRAHLPLYQAWIDGERVPIVTANLFRVGVRVPSGEHRVEIRVQRLPFELSAALGAFALVALFAVAFPGRGRSPLRRGSFRGRATRPRTPAESST